MAVDHTSAIDPNHYNREAAPFIGWETTDPSQAAETNDNPGTVDSLIRIATASKTTRVCLLLIATVAVAWLLQWGKTFFIPVAVAIFVAAWLMPLVDLLQKGHVPRALGAALVLLSLMFTLGWWGYTLRDDARDFLQNLSRASHHARVVLNQSARDSNGWLHHIHNAVTGSSTTAKTGVDLAGQEPQMTFWQSSTTIAAAVVEVVVVLFLIYLLLSAGDLFQRKLVQVISGELARKRVTVEILHGIATQVQRYLAVLVTTNVAIGILTWLTFAALDVEHAAVWGIATGVLHIIPYIGPAVSAIAALLVSSLQFGSLSQGFIVASSSLLISTLIGMLLTTWLASRASHMNSVATFVGLVLWGWLWGIPGLLLGTPLTMMTKVIADRVEGLTWLGVFLGGMPKRERKRSTPEASSTAQDNANDKATKATAPVASTTSALRSADRSLSSAPSDGATPKAAPAV